MEVTSGGSEGQAWEGGPLEAHHSSGGVVGEGKGHLPGLSHCKAAKVKVIFLSSWIVYVCVCV